MNITPACHAGEGYARAFRARSGGRSRIGIGGEEKPRLFLTPSVGAIYLNSFIGPSVGLGLDYRL